MRGLIFCSVISVLCVTSTLHAAIKYTVHPVSLSGGYNLVSGFIETDGTLGELMPSNITDYQIVVTGPLPYTFEDTNPGASISISQNSAGQGLFATNSSLTVTDTDLDLGSLSIFKFRAMDNTDPECVDLVAC